jgi:hypothetical protein
LKKVIIRVLLRRLAKQMNASTSSMYSSSMHAINDIPCTCKHK